VVIGGERTPETNGAMAEGDGGHAQRHGTRCWLAVGRAEARWRSGEVGGVAWAVGNQPTRVNRLAARDLRAISMASQPSPAGSPVGSMALLPGNAGRAIVGG